MKKLDKYIHINSRGAVTIFLIIMLLPSFLFGGYCFDLARLEAAKTMISSAGDLTLTSALTQYNKPLYNRYGLLAAEIGEEENKVLSDYFDSMIESSSILPETSSSTVNLLTSIKSYMSDPSSNKFDNFVQMSTNSNQFQITGVNNTQITNPDTLRSQIVEYMKYRGPISLASGLLTKIKTIGDIDQQTKTVEKKAEYEDKLSDIGDACLAAYKAINDYNETIKTQNISYAINYLKNANDINEICDILAYHKKSDNKVQKWNKNKLSDTNQLNSKSQEELYQYIRKYIDLRSMLTESEKNESGTNNGLTTQGIALGKIKSQLNSYQNVSGIERVKRIYNSIQELNKKYDEYNRLYWYCQQYINNYKKISQPSEDQTKEYNRIYIFYNNFSYKYKDSSNQLKDSIIYSYQNTNINDYVPYAQSQLNAKKDSVVIASTIVSEIDTKLETVVNNLKKITDKLGEAETSKNAFQQEINRLANSEFKSNMQAQYDSSAAKLSVDNLKNLIKKTEGFYKYAKDVLSSIRAGGTFYDKNISNTINLSYISNNQIDENATKEDIKKNYVPFKTNDFVGVAPIEINTSDKFYAYLKSICAGSTKESDSPKEDKEAITNALSMSDKIGHSNVPNSDVVIQNLISSGASSSLANKAYSSGEYNRKETTKSILTYFKNIGSTIQSITNLRNLFNGDTSRDALYTMEYMTEMFSCYTDMKDENLVNLNGEPLNAETCQFFASEIEYILSGLNTPNENLSAVQGQVFATRFVMNLIYAMSDASITNAAQIMATAISGGMPFLIPIVKTVIICAVAIAESSVDVKLLLDGKDVAFIKSSRTFICSPTGLTKNIEELFKNAASQAIDDGIQMVTENINKGIDSVQEYINGYITNVKDNMVNRIVSSINSAVFDKATELLSDIDHNSSLTITTVKSAMSNELEKIKKQSIGNDLLNNIKDEFINYIINNELNHFANYVIQEKENVVNSLEISLKNVQDNIKTEIDYLITNVFMNKIDEKISTLSSSLQSEISSISDSYSEELKSEATEKINKAFDNFNNKINGKIEGNTGTSAGGAGFTLCYKEYLQLFLTMQLMDSSQSDASQRRNILGRSANLISANLNMNNGNVDLNHLYTVLSMKSSVNVGTSFINISMNNSNVGKIDFDIDKIQKNKYTYKYNSAKGY